MATKIKVRLKSYEHTLVDTAAAKIVEIAKRNGAEVSGPIPLPTEKEIVTILRAVHKYKDSREQFEQRTHKRLVVLENADAKVVEALLGVELLISTHRALWNRYFLLYKCLMTERSS